MNDEDAIIKKGLLKSDNHEIVVGGGEGLTSFFVPGDIDVAFRENDWSMSEMVEVLTNIIRDKLTRSIERRDGSVVEEPIVTAREKMAAIAMLDKKAKEAMVLGGLIQKDRLTAKKTTEDGTEVEYNAEGMRLTTEGSSRLTSTLAILEGASQSKSDEVIDVDPSEVNVVAKKADNERRNVSSNGATGGGSSTGSLLPRRPGSSDSDDGQPGSGTNDGPSSPGSRGNGVRGKLHGDKRADSSESQPVRSEDNDQGSTKGAADERGERLSLQPGGSIKSQGTGVEGGVDGSGNRPNPESPKRPAVPGESGVKRTNWWDAGIPRRSPDSDAGSIRDCDTAESSVDRLKRIERARKQAAEAAAGYLERRAKNQRTRQHAPGESNEPGSSSGGPRAAPNPS